ncbi:MAG: aminoacyl-tRNA hydrolase [Planctomycetaceae bacterium]|jgi:peptidyl-tRNA hydrolase, PTH1 family|nr:aminoacyl-tRNA hydrolase [bacterium]MDC0273331.1 aminoacyl-tRNA hydrolase [Planctomycetaceae bacterium]MDC0308477.1 aminoacyl-tRNA hydrolase [Planctomycetaceae bacterium]MDG2391845.1 aminoacyl-tRNA hydrolase [Planctomycetaceae bacterium]
MKLVVGLGNPGKKYQGTRHNVGFEVLAELANRFSASQPSLKYDSEIAEVMIGREKVILLAPQTYMNESGRAVRKCFDFYQPELTDVTVLCDDMNLELGRLRWRSKGSAGGQKGLDDIIRHLGSEEFPRLRIGIGRPPGQMNPADFVLGRFTSRERSTMDQVVVAAADSIELWISEGVESCMNRFNSQDFEGP